MLLGVDSTLEACREALRQAIGLAGLENRVSTRRRKENTSTFREDLTREVGAPGINLMRRQNVHRQWASQCEDGLNLVSIPGQRISAGSALLVL